MMENHSFPIIIANDQDNVYFHEQLLTLIRQKCQLYQLVPILKNTNIWNKSDRFGNTLLHIAAQHDHHDLINYLIECGSPIDFQNSSGKTPLIVAIENHCVQSTETLLAAAANVFLCDSSGKNALHWFHDNQSFGYTYLVSMILNQVESQCFGDNEVIADRLLEAGWRPHKVVLMKNTKVTKTMLDRGCYVDTREPKTGRTVLHEATLLPDVEHVKLFLNYNADPNAMDRFNRTPLHYVYYNKGEFSNERLAILKMLIDQGALPVTTLDNSDWSQVDYILTFGNREAIEILLQSNLDLSRKGEEDITPVHLLASNKNPDVFKALVGHAFEVDSRNSFEETPLKIAASYGNASAVEFLIERGANVNAIASNRSSPLHRCIEQCSSEFENQYKDCVQLLLENGADVGITTSSAVFSNVFSVVRRSNNHVIGELLVAHLALQKASEKPITDFIYRQIRSHPPFNNYYNLCKQQLNFKLYKSVTLYNLLTASDIKFECYMRNQELASSIEQFSLEWHAKLCYFIRILRKRYSKAVKLLELRKEAACHLCEIIKPDYYRHPLIADHIVCYLDEQDLLNFLQVPL